LPSAIDFVILSAPGEDNAHASPLAGPSTFSITALTLGICSTISPNLPPSTGLACVKTGLMANKYWSRTTFNVGSANVGSAEAPTVHPRKMVIERY
jgi:hypothetical protein